MPEDVLDLQEALSKVSQMSETEWRVAQLMKLTHIERDVQDLAGTNGKPGRVGSLEDKVKTHDRIIWMGMGAIALITLLSQLSRFF